MVSDVVSLSFSTQSCLHIQKTSTTTDLFPHLDSMEIEPDHLQITFCDYVYWKNLYLGVYVNNCLLRNDIKIQREWRRYYLLTLKCSWDGNGQVRSMQELEICSQQRKQKMSSEKIRGNTYLTEYYKDSWKVISFFH